MDVLQQIQCGRLERRLPRPGRCCVLATQSKLQGELRLQRLVLALGLGLAAQNRHTRPGDLLAGNQAAAEGEHCGGYADPRGSHNAPPRAPPPSPHLPSAQAQVPPRRGGRAASRLRICQCAGSSAYPSIPSAPRLGIPSNPRFPVAYTPVAVTVYWQPRGAKAPRGRGLGRDMQRTGNPGGKSGWGGSRAPRLYPSP